MRPQVRTIMCGCGMCQFRKKASDTCPMENSKDAIQLWASDFSAPETEVVSDRESLQEVLESISEEV